MMASFEGSDYNGSPGFSPFTLCIMRACSTSDMWKGYKKAVEAETNISTPLTQRALNSKDGELREKLKNWDAHRGNMPQDKYDCHANCGTVLGLWQSRGQTAKLAVAISAMGSSFVEVANYLHGAHHQDRARKRLRQRTIGDAV